MDIVLIVATIGMLMMLDFMLVSWIREWDKEDKDDE